MEFKVLDHGYIRFVEAYGTGDAGDGRRDSSQGPDTEDDYECGIIEAARQSTQGSFRGWEQDEKLLRHLFLSEPQHATPFEFSGAIIEVQAPIFVFREWHRHRTQSYNEMSARYAPLPDLNYIPTVERLLRNSTTNKQAGVVKGAEELDEAGARRFQEDLRSHYDRAEALYQVSLQCGVPKELARVGLPVGRYTKMRASANLRNWLAFMTLRYNPLAQEEIRLYAEALGKILEQHFPKTYAAYVHKKSAVHQMKQFTTQQLSEEIFRRAHNDKGE